MAGAGGDALDWALATGRGPADPAPSALPDDALLLLQVAAGAANGVLAASAQRHRMDAADAMQRVRSRLRAVLFHPQADAYRVLGLDIGADADAIKLHHRLLQQWLHPDRHEGEQDTLLSARVNAAWQALRTPERRMAYDAEQAMRNAALARIDAAAAETIAPFETASAWRRRAPLIALGSGLFGLFVLALHHQRLEWLPVEQVEPTVDAGSDSATGQAMPAIEPSAAPASMLAATHATVDAPAMEPAEASPAPAAMALTMASIEPAFDEPAAVEAPSTTAAGIPSRTPAIASAPVVPVAVATVGKPAPAAPAPVSIVEPEASTNAADAAMATAMPSAAQVREAQRIGARLLAFLRRDSASVPPIWSSLAAQRGAIRLRDGGLGGKPDSSPPAWRVGSRAASMRARLAVEEGEARAWLVARMVWREQRWLVEEVAVTRELP